MKKVLCCLLVLMTCVLCFGEPYTMRINETANEEIVIENQTPYEDAFKISLHTQEQTIDRRNEWESVHYELQNEWFFLVKSPTIKPGKKWKSSSDYDKIQYADGLGIESKSGRQYTYSVKTIHDKLHIYVTMDEDW